MVGGGRNTVVSFALLQWLVSCRCGGSSYIEGCHYVCHSRLQYARLQIYVSTAHITDVPEKLPSMAGVNAGLKCNVRIDTENTELNLWYLFVVYLIILLEARIMYRQIVG